MVYRWLPGTGDFATALRIGPRACKRARSQVTEVYRAVNLEALAVNHLVDRNGIAQPKRLPYIRR